MSRLRFLRVVAVVGVLLLLMVACGGQDGEPSGADADPDADAGEGADPGAEDGDDESGETAGSGQRGHLRIGTETYAQEAWDPILADAGGANVMLGPIFDWLVQMEAGEPVPGVLESFEMADDGMSWLLRLREGLEFHDGSPATVDDLEFTFERYMSEEARYSNLRDAVESVEVVDDLSLRVHTHEPTPYLPNMISSVFPNQGNLMPKDYIEEHGLDHFVENPIGVGPWRYESHTQGDSHHYVAVEDHWRQTPAFERMSTYLVPELDTQLAMLEAGDLDIIYVALDDAERLEEAGYQTYSLFANQPRIDLKGAFDPRGEGMPTQDVRVREALARAINYEELEETMFHGRTLPRVPPRTLHGHAEVDPDFWNAYVEEHMGYDPDRARELLEEAGYPDGFDISLPVSQAAGVGYINDLAEAVQAYWSAIGVNANIELLELAEYQPMNREPHERFVGSAVFAQTGVMGPAPLNMSFIWHSSGGAAVHAWNREDGTTEVFLPELDDVLTRSTQEPDPDARQELINETIEMGMQTYTSIPFGQVPTMIATARGVALEGLSPPLTGGWPSGYAEFAVHTD